jgi:hypothetical protein
MEGSPTRTQKKSRQPHLVESLQKKKIEGAASIHQHSVELNVFYNGADYQKIPPQLWYKVRVVVAVKGNGDLGPSKVLMGGGTNRQDLPGCEFLLPLGLIRVGATKDIVNLLMRLREIILGILKLLLLIGRLGHLENLICKTLKSITVSGLVLSLEVENANAIQEAFEFARPGPVLIMMTRPLHHIDRTVWVSLLVMALG